MYENADLINTIEEINSKLEQIQKLVKTKAKPFLSIDEAVEYLRIPKPTIYGYVSKNLLSYHKLNNRRIYFDVETLDRFILNESNRYKSQKELERDGLKISNNL